MNPDQEDSDLFQIKIDETGTAYIKKLFRLSGFIFILIIIFALLSIVLQTILLIQHSKIVYSSRMASFNANVLPLIYISFVVLNLAGTLFYVKFYRTMHRAVNNHDQQLFNKAFKYAHRNAVYFILLMVMNILIYMLPFLQLSM